MLLSLMKTVLEEGFIYGIMVMGVYITYKILDFPDLSVDGTFPLGCSVTAILITVGVNPWLACLAAFAAGAAAGSITGLLHVKLRVTDLLSGIIVMTALLSINMVVLGGVQGKALLQFFNRPTIFTSAPAALLPPAFYKYRVVLIALLLAVAVKLALDWFLRTKCGLLLRAAGDNTHFVTSLAQSQGAMKILGLAIGNGCTALAGSVLSQQAESASTAIGTGMVVQALASVIIGTSVFGRLPLLKPTTTVLLGALLYKTVLLLAMLWLPSVFLKLTMAVLFVAILLSERASRVRKEGTIHG